MRQKEKIVCYYGLETFKHVHCLQKAKSADYQKEVIAGGGFNPCDVFALAAAVDDSFITKKEEVSIHLFVCFLLT